MFFALIIISQLFPLQAFAAEIDNSHEAYLKECRYFYRQYEMSHPKAAGMTAAEKAKVVEACAEKKEAAEKLCQEKLLAKSPDHLPPCIKSAGDEAKKVMATAVDTTLKNIKNQ